MKFFISEVNHYLYFKGWPLCNPLYLYFKGWPLCNPLRMLMRQQLTDLFLIWHVDLLL